MSSRKSEPNQLWTSDRVERTDERLKSEPTASTGLALDPKGYPLRPQPSDDPQGSSLLTPQEISALTVIDPLKWSPWFKLLVLLQVSFLAFLGPFSQGAIVSRWIAINHRPYDTDISMERRIPPSIGIFRPIHHYNVVHHHARNSICRYRATGLVANRNGVRTQVYIHHCKRDRNRSRRRLRTSNVIRASACGTYLCGHWDVARHGHRGIRCL